MLRNYFKTALRSLLKNKGFSVINILGLGSGIASFVLIALYVYHETSFDRFHAKGDRIYRIVENLRTENELLLQGVSSPPMGPAMQQWFPEVESYVRYTHWNGLVKKDNLTEYAEDCLLMDSTFFDVFSFPLLKGDPSTALDEPYSIVLTASASKKYFGSEEALGQSLTIDNDVFTVTGIASDVPDNAHFHFNMLVSFNTGAKTTRVQNIMHGSGMDSIPTCCCAKVQTWRTFVPAWATSLQNTLKKAVCITRTFRFSSLPRFTCTRSRAAGRTASAAA